MSSLAVPAFLIPAFAQEFRASISGQVTDPSGAPIQSVKVLVANLERNTTTEAINNATGRYLAQFLYPGSHGVSIEHAGFKPYTQRGITMQAADHVDVDIHLQIGAASERVTVTAEAPLLETETASRACTVENRVLENIPANGRNLDTLEYALPGVVKAKTYWGSMELYATPTSTMSPSTETA